MVNEKLKAHYKAIWERGLIHPGTTVHEFMEKLEEEYHEVRNEYAEMNWQNIDEPTKQFIQEATDLVMVVLNMFEHYNIDFEKELVANLLVQESRPKRKKEKA
jgi:phosphoribosyl-ATP pyrophosphohydrolase